VIIEFDTTYEDEPHLSVIDWLDAELGTRTNSNIGWHTPNSVHFQYVKGVFDKLCILYKGFVPSDQNLPINEILWIGGPNWNSFRVKYAERLAGAHIIHEKCVVVLDAMDAIKLKLTLDNVKIKVHEEGGETA
jgi:hypothetical protein